MSVGPDNAGVLPDAPIVPVASVSTSPGAPQFGGALRSVVKLMTGNITANLITAVSSVLVARWTGPREMGIWNTALLVSLYTPILQIGVFNGLNRELPYLIGAGKRDRAVHMAEASWAWAWLLVLFSTLCGLTAALWFWKRGEFVLLFTSLALTATVVSSWPTLYLTTTYRTHDEFGRLAQNTVAVAIAGVALVALVWRFHFHGLLIRASLLAALGALALYWRRPMPVRPKWGLAQLVHLAKVGIPIWFIGQMATFFMSLDRLALVRSTQTLGYFTIAIQVGTFVRQIPIAFTTVFYPQMSHRYGETHCAMEIWRIAKKAALGACFAGLLAGIGGWLILPGFVRLVLPKYVPGIPAARISAFLGLAMGLYLFDNIYNVIRRQDLYIINWCAGCASFALVWFAATRWFKVSLSVASADSMLISTVLMALVSVAVSRRACSQHDRRMNANQSAAAASSEADQ